MTCDIRPNLYDVIYSRDTILHIEDKAALFRRCVIHLSAGDEFGWSGFEIALLTLLSTPCGSFPQRGNILTLREYREEARESLCDLKGGLKRKQQEVGSNW